MGKSVFTKDYQRMLKALVNARVEADLTQIDVAKKLKKPQSFVSKFESGERRLDAVELKLLAKIYKKSLSYFI